MTTMNSIDLISMGLKNLWRRKARTFLTILGVIIGTASIVIMVSLGIAMNVNFEKSLEDMGSLNLIEVRPKGDYSYDPETEDMVRNTKQAFLTEKAVNQMKDIPDVNAVMPQMEFWGQIKAGRYVSYANLTGIDMSLIDEYDFKLAQGELPENFPKNGLLFGGTTTEDFRNPRSRNWRDRKEVDVMAARLTLMNDHDDSARGINVKAVGVLEQMDTEYDWNIYMDIEDLKKIKKDQEKQERRNGNNRREKDKNDYETVKVKVEDIDKIQGVQEQLQEMGFEAWSLSDILTNMKEQSAGLRAVLGAIGAVSLFVAAIGITNTMVMSIYERTKEIGVMKVLGAELRDIKRLFLFESGILGFFGGLFGLGLSYSLSYLLNSSGFDIMGSGMYWGDAERIMSVIPVWLSGLSLVFATVVGIVSGYYPARRAMKLSALEAIRNE